MEQKQRILLIFFLSCFSFTAIQAQSYYIDFTASGAATTLDSIFVENLTQSTSLTLQGSDTLHLTGTTDVCDFIEPENMLKIYPNPFSEKSRLEFYSEAITNAKIGIYDITGKHIVSLSPEVERGVNIFEISGIPSGYYHLIISTTTYQKTAAFVSLNTGVQKPRIQAKSNSLPAFQLKSSEKGAKNIVTMPYTTGDEMRFTGFSGVLSEIINDVPASSKTINFVFTSFVCGDSLTFTYNSQTVTYGTVESNGRCWMDRNLGASQVATSSTDTAAYGDLFQWGRGDDGHQIINPLSDTTSTGSNVDIPGHANFILAPNNPFDWRSPQNDSLWHGVNGINNPCPSGWRLPIENEWDVEMQSWSTNNAMGAFGSPLKLPMAGSRFLINGAIDYVGTSGIYWSATPSATYAIYLEFLSSNAYIGASARALGYSVRCIMN